MRRPDPIRVGCKAANLMELQAIDHRVPPFYVITTEAYRQALDAAGLTDRIFQCMRELGDQAGQLRSASAEIRAWIQAAALPTELASMIAEQEWTRDRSWLAVRSSVSGE